MNKPLPTLALVLRATTEASPKMLCTLCNDYEIEILEQAIQAGVKDPLSPIHEFRTRKMKQEEDFESYLETTLSNPTVSSKVRHHGLRWMASRNKMEAHQQTEADAAQVISDVAYQLYLQDQQRTDFLITGEHVQLRIRVFLITPLAA